MSTQVPFDLNAAADLTDLSIQEIWIKSPADTNLYHKEYYNVDAVTDYIVKDSSVTSVKTFSKIAENGQIPADSPHQGFDKTYTQSFFSGMLRITRPMWRYGIQARKLEGLVKEIRNDAMRFREQVLANPINNMTSTSYSDTTGKLAYTVTNTGGDAAAANATTHTREDGGSDWNNQLTDGTTVNMDFDYDAWKAALKTAQSIKGGVGEELDITLDKLLCRKNSSVHHRAMEVLNTMRKGDQPNTANREGSIDRAFDIVANPYLTSDVQYAFYDSSKVGMKFGFQLKQGMDLVLDPQFVDYDSKEIKYSAGMDFAYGFNDVRPWIFSTGANA